jgi:lipopolysaccharide transport protein LptA
MRAFGLLLVLVGMTANTADLLDQGGNIGADLMELDLRNDRHQLHGNVRISQGAMSIASDEATATALQTDNSRWTFDRSVHVQTAEADLKSSSATARFANGALSEAIVKGTPATFEQRQVLADQQARGRAGQIEYDFVKGIVKMTKDVWFTYGGNEFRGDVVVYNVRDEKVVVNPAGQSNGRVNIRIRPRNGVKIEPSNAPRSGSENGA